MLPLRVPSLLVFAATATLLTGCGQENTVDPEESAVLVRPVARFALPETPKDSESLSGNRTGEEVYKSICTTCHATAVSGAPKTGDAESWGPRIATGYESLVQAVIQGKGLMLPRAGASNLTDAEIQRAVAWLANQAGANFAEPPSE